jgi:hypothetical protein
MRTTCVPHFSFSRREISASALSTVSATRRPLAALPVAPTISEKRVRADRIGQPPHLHIGAAAALRAHEAARREGRDGAAYRVPVHTEAFCNVELAGQLGARHEAPSGDRSLELVGDATP